MQSVITLIFSQVLIKVLGLVYNLYLTNREGFMTREMELFQQVIKYMQCF